VLEPVLQPGASIDRNLVPFDGANHLDKLWHGLGKLLEKLVEGRREYRERKLENRCNPALNP